MKICKLRIRLSCIWYNITLSVAALLLSVSSHAQNKSDSIIVTLPSKTPLTESHTTIPLSEFEGLGITQVDEALQAYGPAAGLDIVRRDNASSESGEVSNGEKPFPMVVVNGEIRRNLVGQDSFDWQNDSNNKKKVARLLSDIPARKIKELVFLKGAEAKAVYGSRGANGVLEVRTRKAR